MTFAPILPTTTPAPAPPRAAPPRVRSVTGLALLTLLLGATAGGGGCARSEAEPAAAARPVPGDEPALAVALVPAREIQVPRVLTVSGSLIGSEQAQVAAGAAGKVLATYVERGSVVRKGSTLAKLDARALDAQVAELTAQIESLRAQQGQADLDCKRTQQMFDKGAIARADFDRARTQCETARWSLAAAEAHRTQLSEALRDTDIRAPFSGLVVERAVSPGEWVRVDSRVVSMVSTDSLRLELTVPESEVAALRPGQPLEFRVPSAGGTATYPARLKYIGPSVRQQSRDAVVEAVLEHQVRELRPGMFVTAQIALGQQKVAAVPATAVRTEGTQHHLFVEVGGRLEDRLVQLGATQGRDLAILDGVKPGERLADPVSPALHDGVRVK